MAHRLTLFTHALYLSWVSFDPSHFAEVFRFLEVVEGIVDHHRCARAKLFVQLRECYRRLITRFLAGPGSDSSFPCFNSVGVHCVCVNLRRLVTSMVRTNSWVFYHQTHKPFHGLVDPLCGTSWDKWNWDKLHCGYRACPGTRKGLQRGYMTCPMGPGEVSFDIS